MEFPLNNIMVTVFAVVLQVQVKVDITVVVNSLDVLVQLCQR